jgi:hypothetical protein
MEYPPPTVTETIFNPSDFTYLDTTSSSGGASSDGSYVNYPSAQGSVSFPDGMDVGNTLTFTNAAGSNRAINNISNLEIIDTTNTTPNQSQTNYSNIYQSGAELYIDNLAPSSVLSITSDSTTFSNDITVNQHLYLSSSVYMKGTSTSGEFDLSGTVLNLQDSSFAINLPSTSDSLTINVNISCGDITSTNITASQLLYSSAIDVSCSSFDVQSSSFAINMPSSSDTLTINSNISCGTITSGNIT